MGLPRGSSSSNMRVAPLFTFFQKPDLILQINAEPDNTIMNIEIRKTTNEPSAAFIEVIVVSIQLS